MSRIEKLRKIFDWVRGRIRIQKVQGSLIDPAGDVFYGMFVIDRGVLRRLEPQDVTELERYVALLNGGLNVNIPPKRYVEIHLLSKSRAAMIFWEVSARDRIAQAKKFLTHTPSSEEVEEIGGLGLTFKTLPGVEAGGCKPPYYLGLPKGLCYNSFIRKAVVIPPKGTTGFNYECHELLRGTFETYSAPHVGEEGAFGSEEPTALMLIVHKGVKVENLDFDRSVKSIRIVNFGEIG